MEGFVRHLVRRFVHERLHDGHAEIVGALTWELPALVVFHVLGVPPEDVAAGEAGLRQPAAVHVRPPGEAEQAEIATAWRRFWRYCEALAEDRRANAA